MWRVHKMSVANGTRLQILPKDEHIRAKCSSWVATVQEIRNNHTAFNVEFQNNTCPPKRSVNGHSITYWLRAEYRPGTASSVWRLYPVLASTKLSLPKRSIEVESVAQEESAGIFVPLESSSFVNTGIPVSIKSLLSDSDLEKRRESVKDELLYMSKPNLVRTVNGGRNDGLGVRDPLDTEFRKEWLNLKKDAFILVQIVVTDQNYTPITEISVHGQIVSRNDNSPILNGLGVVYEVDPDRIDGQPGDVETYAPLYIGRRKLKYWVCVYHDLKDNKVIITAGTVTYDEACENLGANGKGDVRLAEYSVADVKLDATEEHVEHKRQQESAAYHNTTTVASHNAILVPARVSSELDAVMGELRRLSS